MWLEHIHTRRLQVLKPGALTRNNLGGNCLQLLASSSEGATSGGDLLCLICPHRRSFLESRPIRLEIVSRLSLALYIIYQAIH